MSGASSSGRGMYQRGNVFKSLLRSVGTLTAAVGLTAREVLVLFFLVNSGRSFSFLTFPNWMKEAKAGETDMLQWKVNQKSIS